MKSKASQESFKLNHRLRQDPGTKKNLVEVQKKTKTLEKRLATGTGVNKTMICLQ